MTVAAAVVALFMLLHHHTKDGFFPLLIAATAAGGAGAGGLAFMNSGAKWSSGGRSANVVSFYKDTNFAGQRKDYPNGAVQNSLSKGKLGMGLDKENDTYSSLQVPPGLQVQVWKDNDAKGETATFPPGSYSNLQQFGFHDNISSLKVTATSTKCNAIGNQFTPRVNVNGAWKCPEGWTDTGCDWVDGVGGMRQCSR